MPGLFITGTGTDVGKTVVTAGIVRALRADGIDAVPMKPLQTGCVQRLSDGSPAPPDLSFALEVSGYAPPTREWADLCPYRFVPPCSPHLAAALAGVEPSLEVVVAAAQRLCDAHALVVAEGAGGVLVPVNRGQTFLDLICRLAWPVLVVAPPGLGTLNATLLTLQALRQAGASVLGVVLCESVPVAGDRVVADNPDTLRRFGHVPVLGRVPWLGRDLSRSEAWERFASVFNPPVKEWPL